MQLFRTHVCNRLIIILLRKGEGIKRIVVFGLILYYQYLFVLTSFSRYSMVLFYSITQVLGGKLYDLATSRNLNLVRLKLS